MFYFYNARILSKFKKRSRRGIPRGGRHYYHPVRRVIFTSTFSRVRARPLLDRGLHLGAMGFVSLGVFVFYRRIFSRLVRRDITVTFRAYRARAPHPLPDLNNHPYSCTLVRSAFTRSPFSKYPHGNIPARTRVAAA